MISNYETDLFTPLTPDQRRSFREQYLAYLRQRDGVPDRANHLFSVREKFFRDVEERPVRWQGTPPVSQTEFDRHHKDAFIAQAQALVARVGS